MTHKHLPPLTPLLAANEEYRAIITAHPAYADLIPLYTAWKEAEQEEAVAALATKAAKERRGHASHTALEGVDWSQVTALQQRRNASWSEVVLAQRRAQVANLRIPVDPQEVAVLGTALQSAKARWSDADKAYKAERDARQEQHKAVQEAAYAAAGNPQEAYTAACEAEEAAQKVTLSAYDAYLEALEVSPLKGLIEYP